MLPDQLNSLIAANASAEIDVTANEAESISSAKSDSDAIAVTSLSSAIYRKRIKCCQYGGKKRHRVK